MTESIYIQAVIEIYSATKPTKGGPNKNPVKETVVTSDTILDAFSGLRQAASPITKGIKFALQNPKAAKPNTIAASDWL